MYVPANRREAFEKFLIKKLNEAEARAEGYKIAFAQYREVTEKFIRRYDAEKDRADRAEAQLKKLKEQEA